MARFTRLETLTTVMGGGLVPVFYNPDIEVAKLAVKAVAEAGCRCFEMTNRGDRAYLVFQELELFCAKEYPEMILGVGSICDAPTAALYMAQGANFIVGPTLCAETALVCNRRKIPYSPGCGSATEIQTAHDLGAEMVKVFPGGQVGGPAFIKAMIGPCPWTSIMPTGGVSATKESVFEWIGAGAAALGIGSKLITKDAIATGDYAAITENVRNVLAWVKEARAAK
jgi:2-dehydro-3-deoxyphosphogluconate aldolase / (4S)-4-hydroxy-2-oxoglutarate aldolase